MEQTEAQRLVNEWAIEQQRVGGVFVNVFSSNEYVSLAQFILDKRDTTKQHDGCTTRETAERIARHFLTSPEASPIVEKPPLVFGRWIGAQDGKTPDFPVGWMYQMRSAVTRKVNCEIHRMIERNPSQDIEYRAIFTVGKWYEWNRIGECPLTPDTRIQWLWTHETELDFNDQIQPVDEIDWCDASWKIKKFRIVGGE